MAWQGGAGQGRQAGRGGARLGKAGLGKSRQGSNIRARHMPKSRFPERPAHLLIGTIYGRIDMIPKLYKLDIAKPIGVIRKEGDQIFFEFHEDVEISREMMFDIFGNAGIRVTETIEKNGNLIIKKGQILEFSFSS